MPVVNSDQSLWAVTADELLPIVGLNSAVNFGFITASSEDADHPASNLANPATHLFWKSATLSPSTISFATNLTSDSDFFALAGHNFGSGSVAISLQGIGVGDSPSGLQTIVGSFTPDGDAPLILRFLPHPWQSFLLTLTPVSVLPQAAVAYAGKLVTFERSVVVNAGHTPFTLGQNVRQTIGKSDSGQFLGRIVTSRKQYSTLQFEYLNLSWYRNNLESFVEEAQTEPFFVAWDVGEYPDDVAYAWLAEDPMPVIDPVTRTIDVTLKMEGITKTEGTATTLLAYLLDNNDIAILTDQNEPIQV